MDTEIEHLARDTAAHLGGWQVRPSEGPGYLLSGPAGEELLLQRVWNDHARVHVKGGYPAGEDTWHLPVHQITAAAARGPAVIAREIGRRLLPGYRTDLAQHTERAAHLAAGDRQRAQRATGLLAAIPGATAADGPGHTSTVSWPHTDATGRGSIRLTGDGSTTSIELTLAPAQLAASIAAVIAAALRAATPPG
jgi:hypothetical protein